MESRLTIRIEGPGVQQGKIALKDLQAIIRPLELAIRALLPVKPPAKDDDAQKPELRLLLVGEIGKDSTTATLEVDAENIPTTPMLEAEPLIQLVAGIRGSPERLSAAALEHLRDMSAGLREGIDWVELRVDGSNVSGRIVRRDAVTAEAPQTELRTVFISGRLTAVNFGSGRARLQVQPTGKSRRKAETVKLRFRDELAADMQSYARQLVTVKGVAAIAPDGSFLDLEADKVWVERDDRSGLWPAKRFRWPSIEERLPNVDIEAFLRDVHGVDEDDE